MPPITSIDVTDLDGSNGFRLRGSVALDYSGYSVSSAGDVNGDGIDDVIVGTVGDDQDGASDAGAAYVIFGTDAGFAADVDLSTLDGDNGFRIDGITGDDAIGLTVSSGGDVNGDGIDDLILGSRYSDPGGRMNAGQCYAVFGSDAGFSAEFELSALDGNNGFSLNGIGASDAAGYSVSSAGDVNGDGIDDLIVGAVYAGPGGRSNAGQSYVVFGSDTGFAAELELSALDGDNGFRLNGITASDSSGTSVSSAGDVNGDGIDDLIIGSYGSDPGGLSDAGQSYVVFGSDTGFAADIELSALDGDNGFRINGASANDHAGRSVSSAGDVNGDGIDDLIIGSQAADPGGLSNAGQSYVVFGSDTGFATDIQLSALDGDNGFRINGSAAGDASGVSVSTAGDVNGDGIDDLIIGAYFADSDGKSDAGKSYVVFGTDTGFAAALDLGSIDGTNGFVIAGGAESDSAGFSVAYAGDVNNDGFDDVIVGAWGADPNGNSRAGESYVIYGFGANEEPVATAETVSIAGTRSLNIDVLDNDTDGNDDALSIVEFTQGAKGSVALVDGLLVYSFTGNQTGTDTFTYTVSDGNGGEDTASVTVTGLGGGRTVTTGDGGEVVGGSEFGDALTGGTGNDALNGRGDQDFLYGGAGNDRLYGGADDDVLDGGDGSDLLRGGSGNDTASYRDAGSGVTVSLAVETWQNTRGAGVDRLQEMENLLGSDFDDVLTGNATGNSLKGRVGSDVLSGSGGIDVILGGDDNDTLFGGDGRDRLYGGADNDIIAGGAGMDLLRGGDGVDTLSYADAASGVTVSLALTGWQSTSGGGVDRISDFEYLTGSEFDDDLTGDDGANALTGLGGNDILTGGDGADIFIYAGDASDGDDLITDFVDGVDRVGFNGELRFEDLTLTSVSSGVEVEWANGGSVLLAGIDLPVLSEADFAFF